MPGPMFNHLIDKHYGNQGERGMFETVIELNEVPMLGCHSFMCNTLDARDTIKHPIYNPQHIS